MAKIKVAVLGATGAVGQRFVQLLDNHPWFEVTALTGSDRTVGQVYGEACRWVLDKPMPDNINLRQFDNADTLYSAQTFDCLDEAAFLAVGQVYLRYVACYYHFGAASKPGQYHKHLQRRGILRLIADYH